MAGLLWVPSALLAQDEEAAEESEAMEEEVMEEAGAFWYGSLRVGVESSDSQINVIDILSRWGIRGSVDAGEGLTGVYQFEHGIDAPTGSFGSGRLGYVGLSGGFGSITLGQLNAASGNSTGAMTSNAWWYGASEVTSRHGNAISYAFSNDLMSLQADAAYGDDMGPKDLERFEFGLTINVGDLGAVAISHRDDKFTRVLNNDDDTMDFLDANGTSVDADTDWRTKQTVVVGQMSVSGLTVYAGSGKTKYTNVTDAVANAVGATAVRPESKTTYFGARGSIGDTGLSYVFQWRDKDTYKPWNVSLAKSLGSATLVMEHANNDGDSDDASLVGLIISF